MAQDVVMPRLSDSMEEGTVLRWIKALGDEVERGEEVVEIETDKANMVYEADAAGTLIEIVADEGATLPIGEVIARIGESDEVSSTDGESDRSQQPAEGEVATDEETEEDEAAEGGSAAWTRGLGEADD